MKKISFLLPYFNDVKPKEEIASKPNRGTPLPITRKCDCCQQPHECIETFREMIERCINEKDGSIILE